LASAFFEADFDGLGLGTYDLDLGLDSYDLGLYLALDSWSANCLTSGSDSWPNNYC